MTSPPTPPPAFLWETRKEAYERWVRIEKRIYLAIGAALLVLAALALVLDPLGVRAVGETDFAEANLVALLLWLLLPVVLALAAAFFGWMARRDAFIRRQIKGLLRQPVARTRTTALVIIGAALLLWLAGWGNGFLFAAGAVMMGFAIWQLWRAMQVTRMLQRPY
jgi:hypothetical protein